MNFFIKKSLSFCRFLLSNIQLFKKIRWIEISLKTLAVALWTWNLRGFLGSMETLDFNFQIVLIRAVKTISYLWILEILYRVPHHPLSPPNLWHPCPCYKGDSITEGGSGAMPYRQNFERSWCSFLYQECLEIIWCVATAMSSQQWSTLVLSVKKSIYHKSMSKKKFIVIRLNCFVDKYELLCEVASHCWINSDPSKSELNAVLWENLQYRKKVENLRCNIRSHFVLLYRFITLLFTRNRFKINFFSIQFQICFPVVLTLLQNFSLYL